VQDSLQPLPFSRLSCGLEMLENRPMAGLPVRVVNKAIDPSLIKHIDSVGRDGLNSLIKNSIKALNLEL
jgi:hypothetical protein